MSSIFGHGQTNGGGSRKQGNGNPVSFSLNDKFRQLPYSEIYEWIDLYKYKFWFYLGSWNFNQSLMKLFVDVWMNF